MTYVVTHGLDSIQLENETRFLTFYSECMLVFLFQLHSQHYADHFGSVCYLTQQLVAGGPMMAHPLIYSGIWILFSRLLLYTL